MYKNFKWLQSFIQCAFGVVMALVFSSLAMAQEEENTESTSEKAEDSAAAEEAKAEDKMASEKKEEAMKQEEAEANKMKDEMKKNMKKEAMKNMSPVVVTKPKQMSEEEKKEKKKVNLTAAEKIDKSLKGDFVPADLGLFLVTNVSGLGMFNRQHRVKDTEGNPITKIGNFKEEYSARFLTALVLNAKLFDTIKPSIQFALEKNDVGNSLFNGVWSKEDDTPAFAYFVKPHEFVPLTSKNLYDVLGIESKRNIGRLSLSPGYYGGASYDPRSLVELEPFNHFKFTLSHSNFDPLGPVKLPFNAQVRGSISNTIDSKVNLDTLEDNAEHYSVFISRSTIKFTKYFAQKTQLVSFDMSSVVRTWRIPWTKEGFTWDNFKANTYTYQFFQLAYDNYLTDVSTFSAYIVWQRDTNRYPKLSKDPFKKALSSAVAIGASISLNL